MFVFINSKFLFLDLCSLENEILVYRNVGQLNKNFDCKKDSQCLNYYLSQLIENVQFQIKKLITKFEIIFGKARHIIVCSKKFRRKKFNLEDNIFTPE